MSTVKKIKNNNNKAKENLNLQGILLNITISSVNICNICLIKYSLQQNEVTENEVQSRRAGS